MAIVEPVHVFACCNSIVQTGERLRPRIANGMSAVSTRHDIDARKGAVFVGGSSSKETNSDEVFPSMRFLKVVLRTNPAENCAQGRAATMSEDRLIHTGHCEIEHGPSGQRRPTTAWASKRPVAQVVVTDETDVDGRDR